MLLNIWNTKDKLTKSQRDAIPKKGTFYQLLFLHIISHVNTFLFCLFFLWGIVFCILFTSVRLVCYSYFCHSICVVVLEVWKRSYEED